MTVDPLLRRHRRARLRRHVHPRGDPGRRTRRVGGRRCGTRSPTSACRGSALPEDGRRLRWHDRRRGRGARRGRPARGTDPARRDRAPRRVAPRRRRPARREDAEHGRAGTPRRRPPARRAVGSTAPRTGWRGPVPPTGSSRWSTARSSPIAPERARIEPVTNLAGEPRETVIFDGVELDEVADAPDGVDAEALLFRGALTAPGSWPAPCSRWPT